MADYDLQRTIHGDGARLGDCAIDDIFISDRVMGEVAAYRAAMAAALRHRLLAILWMPLKKAARVAGAVRVPTADG